MNHQRAHDDERKHAGRSCCCHRESHRELESRQKEDVKDVLYKHT